MHQIVLGGFATLGVAAIIAIVTLAFKNPSAYGRLFKVLSGILALLAVGYMGYGAGSDAGGRAAVSQISNGVPATDVNTLMPWWPLTVIMGVFGVLITLTWFPEFLGFNSAQKEKEKGPN